LFRVSIGFNKSNRDQGTYVLFIQFTPKHP
jgi:hypothetical protein